jgi:hypothetical protein
MKKWYITQLLLPGLLLFSGIWPLANASAQEILAIDRLEIDLWPEYDRREMLVIYRIELSTKISPPVQLSFRIPAAAGEPHAVAVRDANGALLTAPYERRVEGEWAVITLMATMPGIQLEYYDPQIQFSGSQRNFQYTWPGDYAVGSLSIQLQQPFDASQVKTTPVQSVITPGSDGLSYHTVELGALAAGVPADVNIEYLKASDSLSIESLPVQPISPISSDITGSTNITGVLPWGLGLLGVALLSGGIYWYWRMGGQQLKSKARRRGKRSTELPRQSPAVDDEAIYCHQCGKRAAAGDRFCRSCGTKLRRS